MHALRVMVDIILNDCPDIFAIEEQVIRFNVYSPRLLSVNLSIKAMGKLGESAPL
jgi:hypothetical protein